MTKTNLPVSKNIVVVGTQWGDEGKGKLVDWLTSDAAAVVRFQGGHNAGHTLQVGEHVYKLNLIPSGIVRDGVACYIGNGVVLDVNHLLEEISKLSAGGIDVSSRLTISPGCVLILPIHKALDAAREIARGEDKKIGTTGKGIGPAYEDKVARRAIRLYDIFYPQQLEEKCRELYALHNFLLEKYYQQAALNVDETLALLNACREQLRPMLGDVSEALHELFAKGKNVLFEGAQGTLLDIDHGTYPFVTSSNCVAGQAAAGSGIGPHHLRQILGITKAYCTRVGSGPFPSELDIETANTPGYQMSQKGKEFGTVTGRKRRCGWFDVALLRRSARINGLTHLAITKLDVLDGIDQLKICTGYHLGGKIVDIFPLGAEEVSKCQPIYETMPGWSQSTFAATTWQQLAVNAQKYLQRIEELSGVKIAVVSTGPERDQTIVIKHPLS